MPAQRAVARVPRSRFPRDGGQPPRARAGALSAASLGRRVRAYRRMRGDRRRPRGRAWFGGGLGVEDVQSVRDQQRVVARLRARIAGNERWLGDQETVMLMAGRAGAVPMTHQTVTGAARVQVQGETRALKRELEVQREVLDAAVPRPQPAVARPLHRAGTRAGRGLRARVRDPADRSARSARRSGPSRSSPANVGCVPRACSIRLYSGRLKHCPWSLASGWRPVVRVNVRA